MKETNQIIEETILASKDIPTYQKWEIISYFQALWYDYYVHDKDVEFTSYELKEFWFFLKVLCLSKIVNLRNQTAITKLSRELNRNCKRYENPNYTIGAYKTKEVMYENL